MNDRISLRRGPLSNVMVSVVLPVFNETRVLATLLERVRESLTTCGASWEVIFVNDGSRDGSGAILEELAAGDRRVRVIHLSRNFGHQAALQAGLAHAAGDAVVLMDSDMQDAPEAIGPFLDAWRSGYDVVYAIRVQRKENAVKRFLFAAFHRLLSRITPIDIPADAGNFSLIDRRVAQRIAAMGECDRYFPGLRCWVGFAQKGIPVERISRYDGRPRVSFWGLCRLAKTAIFSFSAFPLLFFQLLGIVAATVCVAAGGYALYCRLFTDLAIPGWTSHVVIGSFFGALNALGICTLGEYVIRIYDQVRNRPMYLIDRTVNFDADAGAKQRDHLHHVDPPAARSRVA
jgi:polyisoprenyl-phosphate glycosyltransferase